MLEIMFYDGWRWGLALQRCLLRSSGMLSREGCRREGRGYLSPPLLLTCFGIDEHDLEWSPSPRQAHDDRPSIPRTRGSSDELGSLAMDATATPRGTPARVIARDNSCIQGVCVRPLSAWTLSS